MESLIVSVSLLNAGAVQVCLMLHDYLKELVVFDFKVCLEQEITGSELWNLYEYVCESDIARVHASLIRETAKEELSRVPHSRFYQN